MKCQKWQNALIWNQSFNRLQCEVSALSCLLEVGPLALSMLVERTQFRVQCVIQKSQTSKCLVWPIRTELWNNPILVIFSESALSSPPVFSSSVPCPKSKAYLPHPCEKFVWKQVSLCTADVCLWRNGSLSITLSSCTHAIEAHKEPGFAE